MNQEQCMHSKLERREAGDSFEWYCPTCDGIVTVNPSFEEGLKPARERQDAFFVHDYENGVEFHKTEEAAAEAAQGYLDAAGDDAADYGWDEATYNICYGKVIAKADCVEEMTAPEGSDFDKIQLFELVKR